MKTTKLFLQKTLEELESNESSYPFDVFYFLNKTDLSFSEKTDVLESLYSNLDEKSRKKSCAVEFFTGTNQEKKQGLVELIKKTLEYYDGYYDESYYTKYVDVDPEYDERDDDYRNNENHGKKCRCKKCSVGNQLQ